MYTPAALAETDLARLDALLAAEAVAVALARSNDQGDRAVAALMREAAADRPA